MFQISERSKSMTSNLWFLIAWCLMAFSTNLVVMKTATESYGYGFNGKQFALGSALISVWFNVTFVALAGWIDVGRIRREWRKVFMPAGFRTSGIIVCGLLVLGFRLLNAVTATNIYKGILIPIAIHVGIKLARMIQDPEKRKQALAKLLAWPQLVSVALALCAVILAIAGSIISGGFNLFATWFPPVIITIYAWCYLGRLEIMRTQTGDDRTYTGGEQPFSALGVTVGIITIHLIGFLTVKYLPVLITPGSISGIIQEMQFTKAMLSPKYFLLMAISGVSFGLYAPASILILMYKDGAVGTVTYGSIAHKGTGLGATILAAGVLSKLIPYLTGKKATPVSWEEWTAFGIFSIAMLLPIAVEMYRSSRVARKEGALKAGLAKPVEQPA